MQKPFVGRARFAVNGVIGSHYGFGATVGNGSLKSAQILRHQPVGAYVRRGGIVSALRDAVGGQMLQSGAYIFLHSFHDGRAQNARQIRILAQGLLHTRPTRIAGNVEDGTIAHLRALKTHFLAHHLAHLFQKVIIPSAGLTDARREDRRAHRHVAVRCFFAKQQWNAKSRVFHRMALHHVQQPCRHARLQACLHRLSRPRVGTKHRPARAEGHRVHRAEEILCQPKGIAILPVEIEADGTTQLAAFFFEGHLGKQCFNFVLLFGTRTEQNHYN